MQGRFISNIIKEIVTWKAIRLKQSWPWTESLTHFGLQIVAWLHGAGFHFKVILDPLMCSYFVLGSFDFLECHGCTHPVKVTASLEALDSRTRGCNMHGGPQIVGCSGCNQDEAWVARFVGDCGSTFQNLKVFPAFCSRNSLPDISDISDFSTSFNTCSIQVFLRWAFFCHLAAPKVNMQYSSFRGVDEFRVNM